jgi:CubicO group peptidase (beta-lactamase class C family)
MKQIIAVTFSVLIFSILSCSREEVQTRKSQSFSYHKSIKSAGFSSDRLALADSFLNKLVSDGVLPNVVTFVARHGVVVHHKAYGWRDIEKKIPIEKNDIFRNASQTKAITSVALMTLYEEGKLLLDDPVSRYIPEFKDPLVLESINEKDTSYTTRPAEGEITIRHLLTHTSGLQYSVLGDGSGYNLFRDKGIPVGNTLDPINNEQMVKKMAALPLMFDPGERFAYGMSIDVVGYLIEVLSGKPLDVFLKERIFDPLGMNDTYFYLPEDKAERLVTLYSPTPEGLKVSNNVVSQTFPVAGARMLFPGGSGLCGTIEDYAKFCQMVLNKGTFNGNRILSRKTIDLMTVNQIGDKTIDRNTGPGAKFGLAFKIFEKESLAGELVSEGALMWAGGYVTDYLIDPKEDMIRLIYTNLQSYPDIPFYKIYNNLIYQALE